MPYPHAYSKGRFIINERSFRAQRTLATALLAVLVHGKTVAVGAALLCLTQRSRARTDQRLTAAIARCLYERLSLERALRDT